MSVNSLHITNGDSVLYTWKKSGLLGTHLAWKDVLHEGPVPGTLPLANLSRVRADYLASRGYGNAIRIHRDFEKRDALIDEAGSFDEIVLWFEHDLYDQLQLLQILHVLRERNLGAGRVELIHSEQYLGMLSPDELIALYPKRKFLTDATARAAARAWQAFTNGDPDALAGSLSEKYPGLPFMRDALRRLCEEFPDAAGGLSRSQRHVLEACAQGARRKEELFKRSQAREEASFMGDSACFATIDDLCSPPAPLLALLEHGYEVTVLGRRILAGDADWLEHQPLDRWIGGTHLRSGKHWRWDEQHETLTAWSSTVQV
ncbi:MAG TPA: DUF1835 domain-containing protein [Candidatus Baltobacteraceae bacterium]|nr:DUF1835 domain-containing protein [Candidatus Baltobacteraceae bacterium]